MDGVKGLNLYACRCQNSYNCPARSIEHLRLWLSQAMVLICALLVNNLQGRGCRVLEDEVLFSLLKFVIAIRYEKEHSYNSFSYDRRADSCAFKCKLVCRRLTYLLNFFSQIYSNKIEIHP